MQVLIRSDMGAVVAGLPIPEGSQVSEGDTLLMLESMKMMIPVPSPRAGVVARVHVREGDVVAEDQVLATLEV